MKTFDPKILKELYKPTADSHKGQNGKLLLIGGSKIFHAASLWSLKVASRIVDMVFYSSVPENNQIVQKTKQEFRDGIVVSRDKIEDYINEADCVLIGPGLPREEGKEEGDDDTKVLTEKLLKKHPNKKWVIDGGSLQVIKPESLPKNSIITPHRGEFEGLFKSEIQSFGFAQDKNPKSQMVRQAHHPEQRRRINSNDQISEIQNEVSVMAKKYKCVILLKGETDIVCDGHECVMIEGGNAGMTKGGTGDVLAGLVAALYCKNEAFLSASAASFINKKAGDSLYKRVGPYFNSSDLVDEIPKVMKELIF